MNLRLRATTLRAKFPKEKILRDILDAQSEAIEDIEKVVWAYLKETYGVRHYSLRQLRQMKHPYAIGSRTGIGIPDYVINMQSGRFFKGFSVEVESNASGAGGKSFARIVVQNHDSKARVLQEGNGDMRPRPWRMAMQRQFIDNYYARLGNELRKRLRLRFYNPRRSRGIARTE